MSTLKLNGATSGSSIIKAPDSGSTGQTFTLPASTGTLAKTSDIPSGITSSADTTAITIDSNEHVGIGIAPKIITGGSRYLTVGTQTAGQAGFLELVGNRTANAGQDTAIMKFINNTTEIAEIGAYDNGSTNGGDLKFRTSSGGTASTQLEITSDGRGLSQFTAKAWVNFQGSGTVSINDHHNVSSITDNGTGNYTLNLANNLGNGHGVMSGYSIMDGLVYGDASGGSNNVSNAGNFRMRVVVGSTNALMDPDEVHCIVFGD